MNLFEILTTVYAVNAAPDRTAAYIPSQARVRARAGHARAGALAHGAKAIARALHEAVAYFRRTALRHRTYTQLMRLDDRLLRDIGIDRSVIPHVVQGLASGVAGANDNRRIRAA